MEKETDAVLDEDEDNDDKDDEDDEPGEASLQGAIIQKVYQPSDDGRDENVQLGQLCYEVEAEDAGTATGIYSFGTGAIAENAASIEPEDFFWYPGASCEDFEGDAEDATVPMSSLVAICSDEFMNEGLAGAGVNGAVTIFDKALALTLAGSETTSCDYPEITDETPTTYALYLSDKPLADADKQITCQEISNDEAVVALAAVEAVTGGAIGEGFTVAGLAVDSCANAAPSENNPWEYEEHARCVDNGLSTTLAAAGLVGSSVTFVAESAALARYMK